MEAPELHQEIALRTGSPSDEAFIFSSWLQSYWDGLMRYDQAIAKNIYFTGQHALIECAFRRRGCEIVVATPHDNPSVILGWLLGERMLDGHVIHYLYVKEPFRRFGIARGMLSSIGRGFASLTYTHTTKRWQQIIKRYPDAVFNPWLLGK